MTPAKVNLFVAFFPYGGNGSSSSEYPEVRNWYARTLKKIGSDPRIGEVYDKDFSDTPITLTRNAAVICARKCGADILVMCDSDMHPDKELQEGDRDAKPFWDSSFDFMYERMVRGQQTVVAAPYCGPPPIEMPYIFKWCAKQGDHPNPEHGLEMFSREEAAVRSGLEDVAALPTGLIMFDMRVFDTLDPKHHYEELCKEYPPHVAKQLARPWFYYEYPGIYQAEKCSTEDVVSTRDMSMALIAKLGYNPLYCNWDAWAGHMKPKCVRKPRLISASSVSKKLLAAAKSGRNEGESLRFLDMERLPGKPPPAEWIAQAAAFSSQSNGK